MEYLILAALVGAGAGMLRVILGYLKNSTMEDFEWDLAIRTLLIALISGAIIGFFYPVPDLKVIFAVAFMGTVTIEELLLVLTRRLNS